MNLEKYYPMKNCKKDSVIYIIFPKIILSQEKQPIMFQKK